MKLADINKRLGIFIVVMIILSPLGLIIPSIFHAGGAWGEWSGEELKQMLGYIPQGFNTLSDLWHPLLPDYNFAFNSTGNIFLDGISYIFSGAVGIMACFICSLILLKSLSREN